MTTGYRAYHPKVFRRRVPLLWWLGKGVYFRYMIREFTAVFVGLSALYLLFEVRALQDGPAAWSQFQARLGSTGSIALQVAILLFVLFHTVTWLNAAPQALVVKMGGRTVPKRAVLAGHYIAWIVGTGFVIWMLRG